MTLKNMYLSFGKITWQNNRSRTIASCGFKKLSKICYRTIASRGL
jgi:hypothetical protein